MGEVDKICKSCGSFHITKGRCLDKNSGLGKTESTHSCEWWKPIFDVLNPEDGFLE